MIIGLPIKGHPVTGRVDSTGWHKRVIIFVGQEPSMRVQELKG
jgi:hypothetical protein